MTFSMDDKFQLEFYIAKVGNSFPNFLGAFLSYCFLEVGLTGATSPS